MLSNYYFDFSLLFISEVLSEKGKLVLSCNGPLFLSALTTLHFRLLVSENFINSGCLKVSVSDKGAMLHILQHFSAFPIIKKCFVFSLIKSVKINFLKFYEI